MKVKSNYSHTMDGLFWFDLPLGLFIAFLFHNIIRDSLFDNLPRLLKSKLFVFQQFNWNNYFKKNWIVVVISILIGALSHIIWDSFTHEHGYFVQLIPFLSNTIEFFGKQVLILKILQHSSTLIGGLVIAFAFYKIPSNKIGIENINLKYWAVFLGLTFLIFTLRLLNGIELKQYGNVIVSAISAGIIAITITSYLTKRIKITQ
jgi:hypothetical protein